MSESKRMWQTVGSSGWLRSWEFAESFGDRKSSLERHGEGAQTLAKAMEALWVGERESVLSSDEKVVHWAQLAGALADGSRKSWPKIERMRRRAGFLFGRWSKADQEDWSQCAALFRLARMPMRLSEGGPMQNPREKWGGDLVLNRLAKGIAWERIEAREASEWVVAVSRCALTARVDGIVDEMGAGGFAWTGERAGALAKELSGAMARGDSADARGQKAAGEAALSKALAWGKRQGHGAPGCQALLNAWVDSRDNLADILINAGVTTAELRDAPKELAKQWRGMLKAGSNGRDAYALAYAKACAMWEREKLAQASKSAGPMSPKKGARL